MNQAVEPIMRETREKIFNNIENKSHSTSTKVFPTNNSFYLQNLTLSPRTTC